MPRVKYHQFLISVQDPFRARRGLWREMELEADEIYKLSLDCKHMLFAQCQISYIEELVESWVVTRTSRSLHLQPQV
jgi:hypothetical protein